MTDAEVYRKAAERVDAGEEQFSCNAIDVVSAYSLLSDDYNALFRPEENEWPHGVGSAWFSLSAYPNKRDKAISKKWRIIALLLMAEMAEGGDL